MYLNDRMMSAELLYYRTLETRSKLSDDEKWQLKISKRGFEGECLYDKIFEQVGHKRVYIYRDLYLKIENSTAQYDSLIISDEGVTVNEIKNYTGDYLYKGGRFYKNNKILPDNAFAQLNRSTGKLISLSNDSALNFKVAGKVVFPNDDFRLHSEDNSIWGDVVVRSNLRKYFRGFNNEYAGQAADEIALLIKSKIVDNSYFNEKADMANLQKGLYCGSCHSFNLIKRRKYFICTNCKKKEDNETHLLRAMSDYKFLFYNETMTCKAISQLINNMIHQRTVQRHLIKHCTATKKGNETTYKFKYYNFEDAKTVLEDRVRIAKFS